jgi:hypothetical protein
MINNIPPWLFSWGINAVLSSWLFKYWLSRKTMRQWLDTGYNKEIEVKFT